MSLNEKPNLEPLPQSGSAGVINDGHYLPPPEDKDGKIWARATVRIQAEPQDLYQLWRDVEKAALWQEQIVSVSRTGEKTSHWIRLLAHDGRICRRSSSVRSCAICERWPVEKLRAICRMKRFYSFLTSFRLAIWQPRTRRFRKVTPWRFGAADRSVSSP
jgi:hypothetical protein